MVIGSDAGRPAFWAALARERMNGGMASMVLTTLPSLALVPLPRSA